MINDAFFNIFGIDCIFNAYTFKGILDAESQVFNSGHIGIRSTLYKLTCKTADCKLLNLINDFGDAVDATISIQSKAYKVMDGGIQEDSSICVLILSKV